MLNLKEINNILQDIHRELRKFIEGSNYRNNISSEELAKSALILLRSLPSARHAVLEHLCSVFDEAANTHLLQIEIGPDISSKLLNISHSCSFIT